MSQSNYQNTVLYGNALEQLRSLPAGIVQCCVCSPPYWGLRDYGEGTEVEWPDGWVGQLGLEPDPEMYISHLRMIFTEVKRVLKDNGTLWLNLGDSYAGSGKGIGSEPDPKWEKARNDEKKNKTDWSKIDLKPKDKCMIPARAAMALQSDGWYLRSEIIWNKPNCMPESVKDRPTNAHEKIFLLSKSKKYFYDHEAIQEPLAESTATDKRVIQDRYSEKRPDRGLPDSFQPQNGSGMLKPYGKKRNKRTVWEVPLKPYSEAHFAVYPPPLITPCIKAGSAKGDLVLDPFFGSGTTGEVALRLQRKFLGIELNKEYKSLIDQRLNPHLNTLFNNED